MTLLSPIGWIVDSRWWERDRPWFSAGYDRWAADYWNQRSPVPRKPSKRTY